MIKNGLIVLLVLLSVFLFSVNRQTRTIAKTQIDTIVNTKTFVKHTKGNNIFVRVIDTLPIVKIDTVFTIRDYNTVKEYKDTILQDSNRYVITDTISQNKIIGRSFQATIQEKTIIITNTIAPKQKASVYMGYRGDLSHDYNKVAHSINLHLKTRNKGIWSAGYGTNGYSFGYSFKLKL